MSRRGIRRRMGRFRFAGRRFQHRSHCVPDSGKLLHHSAVPPDRWNEEAACFIVCIVPGFRLRHPAFRLMNSCSRRRGLSVRGRTGEEKIICRMESTPENSRQSFSGQFRVEHAGDFHPDSGGAYRGGPLRSRHGGGRREVA